MHRHASFVSGLQRCTLIYLTTSFLVCVASARLILNDYAALGLNSSSYIAVPLHFGASPDKFEPVNGFLVLSNLTETWIANYQARYPGQPRPPLIIADLYTGPNRPYFENRLVFWAQSYAPKAVLVLGEDFEGIPTELGAFDSYKYGIDTSSVRFPIVNTNWKTWHEIKHLLVNASIALNATVERDQANPWRSLIESWWFPTWMTVCVVWALANMIVSIVLLTFLPRQRTLAFVVLCFEVASNFMRLPFFLDPFIMWLLPQPVINVFYSMHWPIHLATAIVVLFFWIELTSKSNVTASGGFLTFGKGPAAISISIVVLMEFTVAAVRAAIGPSLILITATAAVYVVMLLMLSITYFYVYYQVRRFFMSSPTMNSKLSVLRRVSIRLLGTAVSFLVIIVWGVLTSTALYYTAIGQSVIQFFIFSTINAGSTLTISAFVESILRNRQKSSMSTSGAGKSESSKEESAANSAKNIP